MGTKKKNKFILRKRAEMLFVEMHQPTRIYSPDELLEKDQEIRNALARLTQREQNVFRMRTGIDGGRAMTLKEIGDVFGISAQRIRMIESRILAKLEKFHRFAIAVLRD